MKIEDKKRTFVEIHRAMAHLNIEERLELVAIEMQNLEELTVAVPWKRAIFEDIEDREYARARSKATGDYEPPDDPDAWSGGFADNH